MQACGACHTQINFPAGEGHPAQANNSNCVACHNADWTASVHSDEDKTAALMQFSPSITSASMDANGTVTVAVKLMNPTTGSVYSDSADKLKFINDLRVYANWGTSFDYATRSARSIKLPESTPLSGSNGIYTYTITALPCLRALKRIMADSRSKAESAPKTRYSLIAPLNWRKC